MAISIVPPNTNKHKLKIKGNLTLIDFVALIIITGLSGLFGWSIYEVTSIVFSILVALFTFSFLASFLLPSRKYKKRVYQLVWDFLKHLSSNKKMSFKDASSEKDTRNLFPYRKIIDNFIETDIRMKNRYTYIGGFKIDGFNINNLSAEEQEIKISQLKNVLDLNEVNLSIVKVNNVVDMLDNKLFLNDTLLKIESDKKITVKQKKVKKEQLQGYIKLHNAISQDRDSVITIKNEYYILFYGVGIEQTNNIYSNFGHKLEAMGLKAKQIDCYELVNVIKQLFDPYSEKLSTKEINEYKTNLKELFAFEKFEIKPEHVIISTNETDSEKLYLNFTALDEYAKYPSRCWLLPLMQTDANVVLNIENVSKESFTKQIDSLVSTVQTNIYNASKKKITASRELQNELMMYESLIDQFSSGEEQIKKMNMLFITSAASKQELQQSTNFLRNNLKDNYMEENRLLFLQLDGFSSALPKITDPLAINLGRIVPTTTIAEGFPFVTSEIKDNKGVYLGTDELGDPVMLDIFARDKNRKNHNMMIMGTTGSGKSTFVKKLLNFHVALNRKVIIVDPEREYKDLCLNHDGAWINAGDGSKNRINPLQPFLPFQEDTSIISNETREEILATHLARLEEWIKILYPQLDESSIMYFSKMVGELYNTSQYKNVSYDSSPQDFPIFDNLISYMENKITLHQLDKLTDRLKQVHLNLLELLKNEFTEYGKWKVLYNGHSSVDISKNNFVVFDINSLLDNERKIQAQMFLITAFIQNEIRKVGFSGTNEVIVAIDEAHLLIDKDNPVALNFTYQTVKRIRKYRGSMILITQNPNDFQSDESISKKTEAMMNNVQYSFIMNLSPKNTKAIVNMYKGYGNGLSANEVDIISHAKQGEGLLFVTGFERHKVDVRLLESEIKVIGKMGGVGINE